VWLIRNPGSLDPVCLAIRWLLIGSLVKSICFALAVLRQVYQGIECKCARIRSFTTIKFMLTVWFGCYDIQLVLVCDER